MAGQIGFFNVCAPEKVPYAIERYARETRRLYGVLDKRLADREFVAGEYSIADIACYPWIVPHAGHRQSLEDFPHLKRWFARVGARPAVMRAYQGIEDVYSQKGPPMSDDAKRILFGQTAAPGS
jgi:GSH-dependent disulfide-bond oxidoreductase